MDKVKIPSEVADAIESLSTKWGKKAYLQLQFYNHLDVTHKEVRIIHDYFDVNSDEGFEKLVRSLYIGYEVEQTPEDKVREYYNYFPFNDHAKQCIRDVLDILDIRVEGVNA